MTETLGFRKTAEDLVKERFQRKRDLEVHQDKEVVSSLTAETVDDHIITQPLRNPEITPPSAIVREVLDRLRQAKAERLQLAETEIALQALDRIASHDVQPYQLPSMDGMDLFIRYALEDLNTEAKLAEGVNTFVENVQREINTAIRLIVEDYKNLKISENEDPLIVASTAQERELIIEAVNLLGIKIETKDGETKLVKGFVNQKAVQTRIQVGVKNLINDYLSVHTSIRRPVIRQIVRLANYLQTSSVGTSAA